MWSPSMSYGGDEARYAPRDCLGSGGIAIGKQNGELVAADPSYFVGRPHHRFQPVAGGFQKLVADGVTERIVDGLETVEVQ